VFHAAPSGFVAPCDPPPHHPPATPKGFVARGVASVGLESVVPDSGADRAPTCERRSSKG